MRRAAFVAALVVALAVPPALAQDDSFDLQRARAKPGNAFFYAKHDPELRYRFRGDATDLRIEVVKGKVGKVVRRWTERSLEPGVRHERVWNGLNERGNVVPDGNYSFRLAPAGEKTKRAETISFHDHRFPLPGSHSYREGEGEFGAPRPPHPGKDSLANRSPRQLQLGPRSILWRYVARRFVLTISATFLLCAFLIFMIDIVELLRQAGKYGRVSDHALAWMALLRLPAYTEILLPFCALAGQHRRPAAARAKVRADRHARRGHVGVAVFGAGPDRGLRHWRPGGRGLYSPLAASRPCGSPKGFSQPRSAVKRPFSRAKAVAPGCGRTVPTAHL